MNTFVFNLQLYYLKYREFIQKLNFGVRGGKKREKFWYCIIVNILLLDTIFLHFPPCMHMYFCVSSLSRL